MSVAQYDSVLTSNDLLEGLVAENTPDAPDDWLVVEGAKEMRNIENSPAVGREP